MEKIVKSKNVNIYFQVATTVNKSVGRLSKDIFVMYIFEVQISMETCQSRFLVYARRKDCRLWLLLVVLVASSSNKWVVTRRNEFWWPDYAELLLR